MEEILCQHGCGQIAIKKNKSGFWICCENSNSCPALRKKNSDAIKAKRATGWNPFEKCLSTKTEEEIKIIRDKQSWRKYKTVEENIEIESKRLKSYKDGILNGSITPSFLGRKHTEETKAKISAGASPKVNGLIKTKWLEIFCPYINENVFVQGTWEYKYAEYLNENKIDWIKDRNICCLRYRLNDEDYEHTYYPDFYLPNEDCFVEVKGFMWKSTDGRVDDERKMQCVIECNKDRNIKLLMKKDLKELGIKVK